MGIGEVTLFWGGGVANKGFKSLFSNEVQEPPNYGDQKSDHKNIQKGIDWYYEDYPDSKPGINYIPFP